MRNNAPLRSSLAPSVWTAIPRPLRPVPVNCPIGLATHRSGPKTNPRFTKEKI